MVNTILARRVNHIVAKGDNPAWPKGSKSRGFSTSAVWLVTEADRQEDGDWIFFGYCHILEWEWGYFTLSEIAELELHGITAEVDCELPEGQTVGDCLKSIFAGEKFLAC